MENGIARAIDPGEGDARATLPEAPAVECVAARVAFGRVAALAGVTVAFPPGSWTTAIGPSGGGKTTLLRVIAGLVPLAGGEIRVGGAVASRASDPKGGTKAVLVPPHERGVAWLPQGESLWPHLSASANVALGLPPGGGRRERLDRAREILERLGVGALHARFPNEISGGEARRVSVARAIASGARVLLLDEPVAHLDVHLRGALMERLREVHAADRPTVVCAEHWLETPAPENERVVHVEAGATRFVGTLAEFAAAEPATEFARAVRRRCIP